MEGQFIYLNTSLHVCFGGKSKSNLNFLTEGKHYQQFLSKLCNVLYAVNVYAILLSTLHSHSGQRLMKYLWILTCHCLPSLGTSVFEQSSDQKPSENIYKKISGN